MKNQQIQAREEEAILYIKNVITGNMPSEKLVLMNFHISKFLVL